MRASPRESLVVRARPRVSASHALALLSGVAAAMRPNRRLHFRTLASSTPHVACSRRQAPTSPSVCSSRRVLRLRARPRGVVARRPLAGARGRAPRGSGPLDANEAGGWRVFTTRVSALEDRTVDRGALSSPNPSMRSAAGTLSPPPSSSGRSNRSLRTPEAAEIASASRLVKRRPASHDPRCLIRQVIGAPRGHGLVTAPEGRSIPFDTPMLT